MVGEQGSAMKSHELMRLLIPEVKAVQYRLGKTNSSLAYQWRSGAARNPIDYLDSICELAPADAVVLLRNRINAILDSRKTKGGEAALAVADLHEVASRNCRDALDSATARLLGRGVGAPEVMAKIAGAVVALNDLEQALQRDWVETKKAA